MYFLCVAYISANNRDINTKLSGYLPWYLGKFWVGGNNHYRSILLVNPISQKIIEILTNKFEDIILGVLGGKGGGSLQLMATHSGGYRMVPTGFGLEYSITTS